MQPTDPVGSSDNRQSVNSRGYGSRGVTAQRVRDVLAHGTKHDATSLRGSPLIVHALGGLSVITDAAGRDVLGIVDSDALKQ